MPRDLFGVTLSKNGNLEVSVDDDVSEQGILICNLVFCLVLFYADFPWEDAVCGVVLEKMCPASEIHGTRGVDSGEFDLILMMAKPDSDCKPADSAKAIDCEGVGHEISIAVREKNEQ